MKDDGQAVTDASQATIDNFLIASGLSRNGGRGLGAALITESSFVRSMKNISHICTCHTICPYANPNCRMNTNDNIYYY